LNSGVNIIPHPEKKEKGGEDAACLTSHLLCVADGVGGWSYRGVDPALYSRSLCSIIKDKFTNAYELLEDYKYIKSPTTLLVDSVNANDH
jgi:serine/threonine protein phosphatase PrpC